MLGPFRRLLLSRPVVALARWLSERLGRILAADFEARFAAAPARGAERIAPLEGIVTRTFSHATAEEKQSFYSAVERLAWADQHSFAYGERMFDSHRKLLETYKGGLAGLRILELGPGHSVIPGVLLYAHGIARYVGADYYPIAGRSSELYRRVREHLADRPLLVPHPDRRTAINEALRRFDEAVDLTREEAAFTAGKVEWRHPVDAAKLPFEDGSFDVVISNAAFEHFHDASAAARESARVLAPGGVGLHQIDLRDHRDFTRPLEFLTLEESAWRASHEPTGLRDYTNRIRRDGFADRFKEAGLEIVEARTTESMVVPDELRARLHADFKSRADLDVLGVFFAVKKR